jgi:hypothetical protein
MLGLRKLRFVDVGTGLSMMLGTASMLVAGALSAADPACVTPASNCASPAPACCDGIFQDAAARLNGYYAGVSGSGCSAPASPAPVCGTSAPGCAPAASGCNSDGGTSSTSSCTSGSCFGSYLDSLTSHTLMDMFKDGCGNNCVADAGWKLSGNIAQSYAANFNNPVNRYNGTVTWPDRSNEYELNQLWLTAERATDTSNKDWDFGGRVDLLYGTNARLTTESGLETPRLDANGGIYGLAIPQFYAEAAYKKWKFKAGHIISPIGYFTVDTTQNFFNTIPYTYQWGEPFTHTGAWATYQVTDNFVVSTGGIRGWDNFDSHNPNWGNLTTWSYTFKDKSNLAQVIVISQEPNFNLQFTQRYYQSLVYTKPIDDNWTFVTQTDFGTQRNATYTGAQANWYGSNNYLYYKVNDKWTWGVNFEWWRDEEGYRVAGFLPGAGPHNMAPSGITGNMQGVPLSQLAGGYNGNFFQTTIGPRWYPFGKPNLFVRPNLRYDWYTGGIDAATQSANGAGANAGTLAPFGNGDKSNQALLVTDICWLF